MIRHPGTDASEEGTQSLFNSHTQNSGGLKVTLFLTNLFPFLFPFFGGKWDHRKEETEYQHKSQCLTLACTPQVLGLLSLNVYFQSLGLDMAWRWIESASDTPGSWKSSRVWIWVWSAQLLAESPRLDSQHCLNQTWYCLLVITDLECGSKRVRESVLSGYTESLRPAWDM